MRHGFSSTAAAICARLRASELLCSALEASPQRAAAARSCGVSGADGTAGRAPPQPQLSAILAADPRHPAGLACRLSAVWLAQGGWLKAASRLHTLLGSAAWGAELVRQRPSQRAGVPNQAAHNSQEGIKPLTDPSGEEERER